MHMRMLMGVLAELRRQRQHEYWTREQLHTHQAEGLHTLRRHASAHSPFYQHFHAGLNDRPLCDLPVLTKALLMEHFNDVVTDRAIRLHDVEAHLEHLQGDDRFLGRYWVNATSGTTGRRGIFVFDRREWTAILASFARAQALAGLDISLTHRMKLAFVASTTPWHMSARAGATLKSWWTPALRLAAQEPLQTMTAHLNSWQPDILVAYASMARILADEQLAGRLHITPHRVFTSSEVLTDGARGVIESAWGAQPFNQYSATETGGIAAECEQHQGMHLFEDQLIVEIVDGENRPVPPGVYGEKVLVTTLWSRTLPLIRYEVSDSVRLAPAPCACGRSFHLIDAVQGRTEDVLRFPAGNGTTVAVHPNSFHAIMDTIPATGWQIVQAPDRLQILLSGPLDAGADERLVVAVQQVLAEHGVVAPPISVQRVTTIPKSASGKAPLIKAYTGATHVGARAAP